MPTAVPRSVAIIGAGPAGLVAAKTLLQHGFSVQVFDKAERVGGMWALEMEDVQATGKCSPLMRTNLSRSSVAFSDFAWEEVGLGEVEKSFNKGTEGEGTSKDDLPTFPQAWQVGRYLQAYAKRYLPPGVIGLGCEVVNTDLRTASEPSGRREWVVRWKSRPSTSSDAPYSPPLENKRCFDYLVNASGFFGSPRPPSIKVHESPSQYPERPKMIHSSHYRQLSDLISPGENIRGDKIVVIGGSHSGIEVAATVAAHLSNAAWGSLNESNEQSSGISKSTVVHIVSRPFYVLPRHLPSSASTSTSQTPRILPLDLVMYDLSSRPAGPISLSTGLIPEEKARKTHTWLQGLLGNQHELGEGSVREDETAKPAYVGISDSYMNFVRGGRIVVHRGTATTVMGSGNGGSIYIKQHPEGTMRNISGVAAIICATGFSPHSSLTHFPQSILEQLSYSTDCDRLPLLLEHNSTFAASIPELAFIGFYEGPFWGVMEMQARLIAKKWHQGLVRDENDSRSDTEIAATVRRAIFNNNKQVPQQWMSDYVGLMETMAQQLGIEREPLNPLEHCDPVVPARYSYGDIGAKADLEKMVTTTTLASLETTLSTVQPTYLASSVFHSLSGAWKMERTLTSHLPGFPSGTFIGQCHFHPRAPTAPGYEAEYVYVEEGSLRTPNGLNLTASKKYAYRLGFSSSTDVKSGISAWFVKDDGRTVDNYFHSVGFGTNDMVVNNAEAHVNGADRTGILQGYTAEGSHLCEQDLYDSHYEFYFSPGTAILAKWELKYVVKGPRKDYTSETWFER